ncbi:TIM-barrel domain-containing protein [Microbacterium protaetiae]|uniref:TIM-barrel domain-containing protein n=1 Tax=Microbacterium protaetiae TaxID=2509458 RepID=UPI001A920EC2|nr:TIM-barrel domain-containing protein [Microbacterium protaetiae]
MAARDDILVAPVLEEGATAREVYLPEGEWADAWTGESVVGGQAVTVAAPLERIPVFVRDRGLLEVFAGEM